MISFHANISMVHYENAHILMKFPLYSFLPFLSIWNSEINVVCDVFNWVEEWEHFLAAKEQLLNC